MGRAERDDERKQTAEGKERKVWTKACRRALEERGQGKGEIVGDLRPLGSLQVGGKEDAKACAPAEASFYLAGSRSPERPTATQARFQMSVGRCRPRSV